MNKHIENLNYYRDARTQGPANVPDGFPVKWVICSVCRGEGKHVNPSIDAGGLTSADFADDPDFREDYFNGVFDIACNRCAGSGKVQTIDSELCDEIALAEYHQQQEDEASDRAAQLAELAMGA